MKKLMIMLAVATIPAAAGCNCCGLAACPCNPCNWFNQGAYCGPTPTYAPIVAAPCPTPCAPASSTVLPQYPVQSAVPFASAPMAAPAMVGAPMMGAPMIADPTAQQMVYAEPGCGYVESGCGYTGSTVGYGPMMPMGDGTCCEAGSFEGAVMTTPSEQYVDPQPAAE